MYFSYLVVLFYCHFIWFYFTCLNLINGDGDGDDARDGRCFTPQNSMSAVPSPQLWKVPETERRHINKYKRQYRNASTPSHYKTVMRLEDCFNKTARGKQQDGFCCITAAIHCNDETRERKWSMLFSYARLCVSVFLRKNWKMTA